MLKVDMYNQISYLKEFNNMENKKEYTTSTGSNKLHSWWSLSYAQYLTIPRTVLQSMPDEWQGKMAELLEELDERIDWRPKEGRYYCYLRNDKGQFVKDQYANYERGRRRLKLLPKIDHQTKDMSKIIFEGDNVDDKLEIFVKLIDFLGDEDQAKQWLYSDSIPVLNGEKPINIINTPEGLKYINDIIERAKWGVYS